MLVYCPHISCSYIILIACSFIILISYSYIFLNLRIYNFLQLMRIYQNNSIKYSPVFRSGTDRPPDVLAAAITLCMMVLLAAGVKKSLVFNNVLNVLNLSAWVFLMTAGVFYIDTDTWTNHGGFLPMGWSGVSVVKVGKTIAIKTMIRCSCTFDKTTTFNSEFMNPLL